MGKFRLFIEASGVLQQDFSHLNKEDRMKQGRDLGESFIKNELLKHGIRIVTVNNKLSLDTQMKVDGFLNGDVNEPVQIKLRKTDRAGGGDDIPYELLLNFNSRIPIQTQLQNPRNQGRYYKGQTVKHYFIMDKTETKIYHVPANKIREAVMQAVAQSGGIVERTFRASNNVELRPITDNNSGMPKLIAFVPLEPNADHVYEVGKGQNQQTVAAPMTMSKKDYNVAAAQQRLLALQAKQKAEVEARRNRNQAQNQAQLDVA